VASIVGSVERLITRDGTYCAVTNLGDLWCWGEGSPIPGTEVREDVPEPVEIETPDPIVDASVVVGGLCALVQTGEVYCTDRVPPSGSRPPTRAYETREQ
jgi:hypothetical protein